MVKFQEIGSAGVSIHDLTEHLFELDEESCMILFYKEQCDVLSEDVLVNYAQVYGILGMKHLEHSILSFMAACIGAHPSESQTDIKKPQMPLSPYDFEAIGRLLAEVRDIGNRLCGMASGILKSPLKTEPNEEI